MVSLRRIGWALLVVLPVAGLSAAAYFSERVLYPTGHFCKKDHYIYCSDPSELGLPFENVELRTADGLRLDAWYLAGRPGAGGIVLVHGHGATRREGLRFAPALLARGFHLLMPDLRGSGKSQPSVITMGYLERRDVHAGVDYLLVRRALPGVGVFGFSMGAATSIMAMAEDRRIRAGVFDSGFSSIDQVLSDRAWYDYHLPRFPLVPLVRRFMEARAGISTIAPTPEAVIGRISPRPVFLIHGRKDQTVRFHEGEKLFAAAREPKRFWRHDGEHTRAYQADTAYAIREVPAFFAAFLPTGR